MAPSNGNSSAPWSFGAGVLYSEMASGNPATRFMAVLPRVPAEMLETWVVFGMRNAVTQPFSLRV